MTRVLIGEALVNEDERLQARINQLDRQARSGAAPVAAHRAGGQRLARRRAGRRRRADRLRARPLAALRQERLQAHAAGRLGAAAQVPVRLMPLLADRVARIALARSCVRALPSRHAAHRAAQLARPRPQPPRHRAGSRKSTRLDDAFRARMLTASDPRSDWIAGSSTRRHRIAGPPLRGRARRRARQQALPRDARHRLPAARAAAAAGVRRRRPPRRLGDARRRQRRAVAAARRPRAAAQQSRGDARLSRAGGGAAALRRLLGGAARSSLGGGDGDADRRRAAPPSSSWRCVRDAAPSASGRTRRGRRAWDTGERRRGAARGVRAAGTRAWPHRGCDVDGAARRRARLAERNAPIAASRRDRGAREAPAADARAIASRCSAGDAARCWTDCESADAAGAREGGRRVGCAGCGAKPRVGEARACEERAMPATIGQRGVRSTAPSTARARSRRCASARPSAFCIW